MLVSFARFTLTIVTPGTKTVRGSEVPDWDNATTTTVKNCVIDTSSGLRDRDNRDGQEYDLVALLPNGTVIDRKAHVRVPGYTLDFEIVDGPRIQPSPTGRLDHVQVTLKAWEG